MIDKHKEFLRELAELSKKYDLWIGGCGCCGSPYASPSEGKGLSEYKADCDGTY